MINLSQELTDADYSQKVTVPTDQQADFEVPEKIGKYEVCEQIGKGTCGVVHRGFDPFVQRNVAIKIARSREESAGSSSDAAAQAFFTEAHAAGKLQHPHIVSLFDAGIEDDCNYIVMEYLEGITLEKYTRGGERLAVEKIIDVAYKCCKALGYSHSQGVVHRDIKPTNIMITREGDVKIMDFSIALMNANKAPGQRSGAVGTPGYMSPEQVLGKETGPTSDLYSLAVVMFEMLTGQRLFESKTMRELFVSIIREPARKLSSVRPDLPVELSQILEKALRKKPQERYQSGQEFAVALGRLFDRLRLTEKHVSRSENRNMLQNLNFFNGFSDNEIDEILDASHLIQYKQEETIINEGDVDNCFYIIVVGTAGVMKAGVLLDTLREGDCFGEIGFLMQTKRTASIVAHSDMLVLKVNELLMDQVQMETQLHYYKAFVETLVYRLSVTSARLSALRAGQRQEAAEATQQSATAAGQRLADAPSERRPPPDGATPAQAAVPGEAAAAPSGATTGPREAAGASAAGATPTQPLPLREPPKTATAPGGGAAAAATGGTTRPRPAQTDSHGGAAPAGVTPPAEADEEPAVEKTLPQAVLHEAAQAAARAQAHGALPANASVDAPVDASAPTVGDEPDKP